MVKALEAVDTTPVVLLCTDVLLVVEAVEAVDTTPVVLLCIDVVEPVNTDYIRVGD